MPATVPISATGIDMRRHQRRPPVEQEQEDDADHDHHRDQQRASRPRCSAPEMKTESSLEILTSTPAGRLDFMSSTAARTPSEICTVLDCA